MLIDTPAAIRQRRQRDRRRRGFRCLLIEIGDADIAGLVGLGLLDRLQRRNPDAIQMALSQFLDRALAEPASHA